VEGHGVHWVARPDKSAAAQIRDVVDTYRRSAELPGTRHCEQTTAIVGDREGGLSDLGEGPVTEQSIDTQRTVHTKIFSPAASGCGRRFLWFAGEGRGKRGR
jgi:hypothetical protein